MERSRPGRDFLTHRERQVLDLVATGEYNKQIARDLGISIHTVRSHLRSIYAKLRVSNRIEAVSVTRHWPNLNE